MKKLTLEFKDANDTDGLKPFDQTLIVDLGDDRLGLAEWSGREFRDIDFGHPVYPVGYCELNRQRQLALMV